MPTFIVANANFSEPFALNPDDEHHLTRVLRVHVGETFTITDNKGQIATCAVTALKPFAFSIEKISTGTQPLACTVYLPLIEQQRLEWAIEKLTELNVACVQLVTTERTQLHTLADNKFMRLEKIARTAQIQCGRAFAIEISLPQPLLDIIPSPLAREGQGEGCIIVAHPSPVGAVREPPSISAHEDGRFANRPYDKHHHLVIGPEGGLTENEIDKLRTLNAHFVNLGETILRTETAALSLVTYFLFSIGT